MKLIVKGTDREELARLKKDIGRKLYYSLTKEQRLRLIVFPIFELEGTKTPTEYVQDVRKE